MLDRIVIEKVGAGLGLAFALALLVKMLLPHARRVQVDLWLHTQRLRLRPSLRASLFRAPLCRPAPRSQPPVAQAAPVEAGPVRLLSAPAARSESRGTSPRRHRDGEWSGNVFHLRSNPAHRALH